MLLQCLIDIPDLRTSNNTTYKQHEILFCTILAFLCGADSYRKIHTFIELKFKILQSEFNFFDQNKIPAYNTIRDIIQNVGQSELEKSFRNYTESLLEKSHKKYRFIACDGKVLRGSFDHLQDKKAAQLLSVFCTGDDLILGHEVIEEKSNEIPALRKMGLLRDAK